MEDVLIYGCGGLGQLVRDILLQGGRHRPIAFLDSDPAKHGRSVDGLKVYGGVASLTQMRNRGVAGAVVAIGHNHTRVAIAREIERRGIPLISAIHPLVALSPSAVVGRHVIIGARAIVCVNVRIGPHTILAAGAIADHDVVIGTGVHIHTAVRLAGGVRVDDYAVIGIGSSVIPGRSIGRSAHVQPGSVVIHPVMPNQIVGGVPARAVRPPTAVRASSPPRELSVESA